MISDSLLENLEYNKVLSYISKYTLTVRGKENILSARPFAEKGEASTEGSLVNEAKEVVINSDFPPLSALPDLTNDLLRSKIENTVLPKESILSILSLAETSRSVYQFLKNKSEAAAINENISQFLFVDKNFEHFVGSIFNAKGEIKESASKKLRSVRKEIRDKNDQLTRVVASILKKLADSYLVQENYLTLRDGRIVLPVKVEHKRHVRGFIHSESSTGQTVYIEPAETLELNNDLLSLRFEERREEERILKEITKRIASVHAELKTSLDRLAHIDALFAKAKYSLEIIGAYPEFDQNAPFNLIEGRHPILLRKLGREKTAPLSFKLDNNKVIVITGPNAGGKTVVLKTIGLLTLLGMAGFHIPVHPDSNFHFFSSLLIDIGDKQSIEDDLSTFSSHLFNIKEIIERADNNSLIMIDEIGTGTDPAEGSALASATLLELQKKNATVFATTHHGTLKLFANKMNGFENASMEFDTENLIPTYKFSLGLPGSSYAFEVAERIGLNKAFIKTAKNYLDVNENKIEEFLIELEKKSFKYKQELNKLEIENSRLHGLTTLYEKKISELEDQKKEILKETKSKAQEYLVDVNKKIESTIKKIRENAASSEVIKQEKQKIENIKKFTEELVTEKEVKEDTPFSIGDFVSINDTSTQGEITMIDAEKNICVIESGTIKLTVPIKNIRHSKKRNQKKPTAHLNYYRPELTSLTLDIRGKRPEEAEFIVTKFLDDAVISNNNRVEILHGKGTGALKNSVQEIIKNHIQVKNYYFADIEYGGDGITVVELK